MASGSHHDSLERIKQEVDDFIRSAKQPLLEASSGLALDLSRNEWQATIQYGKLLLEVWNPGRSFAWRVEDIAYRDHGQLGLFVRAPGGREVETLELHEAGSDLTESRDSSRSAFRRELIAFLRTNFPGWRLEHVSNSSDREHSFSSWYVRGLARNGRTAWAFIGLGDSESFAAADAVLAYGLNWLSWLRARHDSCTIAGLKLFLPSPAIPLTAHRAAFLNARVLQAEIFAWPAPPGEPLPVDLKDFGNVETRLTMRRSPELWLERHRAYLLSTFGDAFDRLDLVPNAAGNGLSIRVLGLEVARLEGEIAPRLFWGLEGRKYRREQHEDFEHFLRAVLEARKPQSADSGHEFYRLQPERWLESLLVRDLSRLDPSLRAECVYPQVPAFSGGDRGVVDILSILQDGRLAVIELKLHEEMTLPLQGLDYWLRVKWLNDRRQFQAYGYFPDLEISSLPPVLYLVSPAFRFHSSTGAIIRYLDPSIEVVQVGLNETWRSGLKVLLHRRTGEIPPAIE